MYEQFYEWKIEGISVKISVTDCLLHENPT